MRRISDSVTWRLARRAKRSRTIALARHVAFYFDDRYGDVYVQPLARDRREQVERPFGIYNIELTNHCPFACVMCPRTNNMTRPLGSMSFELFKKVVDEYVASGSAQARHRRLWLHGFGESLLHPGAAEFIRYASDRGTRPCLSVNPLLLTENLSVGLLEARPDALHISLDGHDDRSFAAIRGLTNVYERSRVRLLEFLDVKRRGSYSTRVVLSMINFPLNRPSIKRRIREWRATPGIDEVSAKRFTGWDGSAKDVNALAPRPNPARDRTKPVLCGLPWRTMTVLWNGDVVPCSLDFDSKVVLGNVASQTLTEIWNGQPMLALRRDLISGEVENPLCKDCWELRG